MMMRGRTLLGAWVIGLALICAPAHTRAEQAPAAATRGLQERPELFKDQPPPTLWDRRGEVDADGAQTLRVSDSQGLINQILRTLVALCGVLFLMWAFARVIGPRLGRVLGAKRSLGMQVADRVSLDGRNTLVRVTMADQSSYLIACGDHSVTLIDKIGPSAAAAPRPATSFAQRMGAQPAPEE